MPYTCRRRTDDVDLASCSARLGLREQAARFASLADSAGEEEENDRGLEHGRCRCDCRMLGAEFVPVRAVLFRPNLASGTGSLTALPTISYAHGYSDGSPYCSV